MESGESERVGPNCDNRCPTGSLRVTWPAGSMVDGLRDQKATSSLNQRLWGLAWPLSELRAWSVNSSASITTRTF